MKNRYYSFCVMMGFGLAAIGCNNISKEEILTKVAGKSAPNDIVAALGEADTVEREGAVEHWRYAASGGDVCFSVAGSLAMRMGCQ